MTTPATPAPVSIERVLARTRTDQFRRHLTRLLLELCAIDTAPRRDVSEMRRAEGAVFEILERELGRLSFAGARVERLPIDPMIRHHPYYSLLHLTKTPEHPEGLTPEEAYAGRGNLVYVIPGSSPAAPVLGAALNAHIDVIAPYFPPRLEGGVVHGRGACDDKGGVVAILGALRAISDECAVWGCRPDGNVVGMFVIEEEPGGNGSLSLAVDRELKSLYDSMLVVECTGNRIHPANRGAVWYQAQLTLAGASCFEMFAFVNEEMEREGRAIKAESRHPLFPQRPVQTCHGVIGHVGEHPSRICGEVSFSLGFERPPTAEAEALVRDCLEFALAEYVGRYGDKTRAHDPSSGKPKVARHFDLRREHCALIVDVHGSAGHMGSIDENDGAITKMAAMVRALVASKRKLVERAAGPVTLELAGRRENGTLRLEGGQGFVPTHSMDEVMVRMRAAAERGAEAYLRKIGRSESGAEVARVTYDKLHNAAFDGDPDSPAMRRAAAAARRCGLWDDQPITGWTVSCDARLFATEHPGMPVLTFGPGHVGHAHSDQEQLSIDELVPAVQFLAAYLILGPDAGETRPS
jgi:acetylornithine deacetylase/succinyl-diaminopimelate desuccinylase-like protein